LASLRLSLQSTVASDYIILRSLDARRQLLANAVVAYGRTLEISENKYKVGVAAKSDVVSAQAQLDSARAQEIDATVQRAQLEHAIAVLIGKMPATFSVPVRTSLELTLPSIPPVLASELLERRPDVAEEERLVASANAKIGVQTAAYFPSLSISASGGYTGSPLSKLFTAPFKFWSLGAQASDSLLDWGERHDQVLAARATYQSAVAAYRGTVLSAFQQVEDGLSNARILAQEAEVQAVAVNEASEAAKIALNEYRAGTVDYTTVATAQVTELTDRETALTLFQDRLTSDVSLIVALGGGWSASDLPSSKEVFASSPQEPSAIAAVK
jgi:NodT family efflux transporter outer membrane factor (OMF) lipoprotein